MKTEVTEVIELPTAAEAAERIGWPLDTWVAQCHGVSAQLVTSGVVEGAVRRGYFIGETKPGAYLHERPCQHSWIALPDGRVCDPTRFAFVGGDPELWVGPDDEYDVGGCKRAAPKGEPPDSWDTTAWNGREVGYIELKVGSVDYVADLVGVPPDFRYDDAVEVTFRQLAWLSNLPVKDEERPGVLCRMFAAEVFEAIEEAGHRVMIPIDRWEWIVEEGRRTARGRS